MNNPDLVAMSDVLGDDDVGFDDDMGAAAPTPTQPVLVPKVVAKPSAAVRARDWFKAPSWSNGPARWKVTLGAGAVAVAISFVGGYFGFKKRF